MITDFQIFESKNIQNLYHILDTEKLHFVLTNNEIKSYKFHYISTTRNKMMNGYLGDNSTSIFKLELDGPKLSDHYKMKPYQDSGWELGSDNERTHFYHQEWEEQIQTRVIKNARKYIIKIILLKNRIERLKDSAWFENHFSTSKGRKGKWVSLPDILKDIIEKYKIELWVQEGSVIKKDDEYVESIINYDVRKMYHGFALYWRGYIKKDGRLGYTESTIALDKRNKDIEHLVVGYEYDNIWVRNKIEDIDKDTIKKRPKLEHDITLSIFDFEYTEDDIIKREGEYILIRKGELTDVNPIQKYDYSFDKEMVLDREY